MDRDKLKLIVHNLELLVDSLKKEILLDSEPENHNHNHMLINDYDEVYEELD